jgi:hypothetical protein
MYFPFKFEIRAVSHHFLGKNIWIGTKNATMCETGGPKP